MKNCEKVVFPIDWQDAADAVKKADLTLDDQEAIERVVGDMTDQMYMAMVAVESDGFVEVAELINAGLMSVKVWCVMIASGIWPYVAADLIQTYSVEFECDLRSFRLN